MIRKTNYSNKQLSNLIIVENHDVNKVGDYYQWSRDNGDDIEYVDKDFDSIDKAYEWIYYNIALWRQELNERIDDQLSNIEKQKITESISNAILNLRANGYDDITYERISGYTGYSQSKIKRYIDKEDRKIYIKHGRYKR